MHDHVVDGVGNGAIDMGSKGSEETTPVIPLIEAGSSSVIEYEDSEAGGLQISAAVALSVQKNEDRHALLSIGIEPQLAQVQQNFPSDVPRLIGFAGIYDGHDGPSAADYCANGMLMHILTETAHAIYKHNNNTKKKKRQGRRNTRNSNEKQDTIIITALDGSTTCQSPIEAGLINAYLRADARFVSESDPPCWHDVEAGTKHRTRNNGFLQHMCCGAEPPSIRGGTTALSLCFYAEKDKQQGPNLSPLPYAMVANTGDCRLLTDDGGGAATYRQVTFDHRPSQVRERRRLKHHVLRGDDISVERETKYGVLRLYPGGLSVSRTLGDATLTEAAICTPEIFQVPLLILPAAEQLDHDYSITSGAAACQRFVLASDGLWDVLSNARVGELAARIPLAPQKQQGGDEQEEQHGEIAAAPSSEQHESEPSRGEQTITTTPKQAAQRILEECLANGGIYDDVTVMVIDIRRASTS